MISAQTEKPRSARKVSWDVLRVVAIGCVLLHHGTLTSVSSHPHLGSLPFTFPMSMGASTLMVVSAFFACATLNSGRPGQFLWRRMARLLPAYMAAVVLTYAVQRWIAPEGWNQLDVRDVVYNLLLLNQWFPDVNIVDFAYWTIPVQIVAFIAAAALVKVLRGTKLRVFLWALVLTPLLLRPLLDHSETLFAVYNGFAMHRAQLFAAGIAIWLWHKDRLGTPQLIGLLFATLFAQAVHTTEYGSTVGFGFLLLLVCAAAAGPDWVYFKPVARPVTWLAGISYGVYLVHQQIGTVVMDRVSAAGFGSWWLLVAFLTSALVLGWAMTKFVERPAYRLLTQIQSGSSGSSPRSPEPSVLPVSQPSTALADPLTEPRLSGPFTVQPR
ncbi:Peptidoglycan/LPS O-acetylase OafA/YrhL, contains acyltransferase and SGNH-hydrolase domains [Lentzea fradiae]|uniref:Peptidoglycan/LPS O-acetylase OafA/YrhL, contains acyltransferase and SGNH-hydrolase domains n=1 Tax=Lentzea fradiae TaxID=200378 RepID=A0A1G7Y2V5_9PSEU|nr:Peptidoglycan/LPS O-acetylase OafA/YrhL, contains acyltransferase and SGNH-hydrolase domains [Lentzea fradiae]